MAQSKLYDLVKMTCSTVGTGTLNLTGRVAPFLTVAEGGAADGDLVSYTVYDPNGGGVECGQGTVGASGTTISRDTVRRSSGASNTAKISLSGSAIVGINATAEDLIVKPSSGATGAVFINGSPAFWDTRWYVDATTGALTGNFNGSAAVSGGLTGILLQLVGTDAAAPRIVFDSPSGGATMNYRRSRGTYASPTAVLSGDNCGGFNWLPHNGSAYVGSSRAFLRGESSQDFTTLNNGMRFAFGTTLNGTATVLVRGYIENDGGLVLTDSSQNQATGGSKGTGTINIPAKYYQQGDEHGEYIDSGVQSLLGVTVPNTSALIVGDVAHVVLTAGDWDIAAGVTFGPNSGSFTRQQAAVSLDTISVGSSASPTLPAILDNNRPPAGLGNTYAIGPGRQSLGSTTTVYLNALVMMAAAGTVNVAGYIRARRVGQR